MRLGKWAWTNVEKCLPITHLQSKTGTLQSSEHRLAPCHCRYEPLMLRKPDRRRSTTQTWSFRDGKLTCGIHGLVVQVSTDEKLNFFECCWYRWQSHLGLVLKWTESFGAKVQNTEETRLAQTVLRFELMFECSYQFQVIICLIK